MALEIASFLYTILLQYNLGTLTDWDLQNIFYNILRKHFKMDHYKI